MNNTGFQGHESEPEIVKIWEKAVKEGVDWRLSYENLKYINRKPNCLGQLGKYADLDGIREALLSIDNYDKSHGCITHPALFTELCVELLCSRNKNVIKNVFQDYPRLFIPQIATKEQLQRIIRTCSVKQLEEMNNHYIPGWFDNAFPPNWPIQNLLELPCDKVKFLAKIMPAYLFAQMSSGTLALCWDTDEYRNAKLLKEARLISF